MKIFTFKTFLTLLVLCPLFATAQLLNEDFETWPPADWAIYDGANGAGGNWDWDQFWDPNDAPGNENVARVTTEPNDGGLIPEDWLVTPQLRPVTGNNILTFYQSNWTASVEVSKLHVKVSTTSQTDHAAFTNLATYTESDIADVYVQSSIDLSAYNDVPIYIAFVVESDWGDDWYIDLVTGIFLFTPDPDAGITAINGPGSDCSLSNTNTITATIKNFGIETISNCPIEYQLNNGGWISAGTYTGAAITSGNSANFSFDLDFSLVKSYEVAVRTQYPGDEKPSNDSLGLYTVSHLEPTDLFAGNVTNNFENATNQAGWNTVDVNGDGAGTAGKWSLLTNSAGCSNTNYLAYNKSANVANDWLFSPCLDFVAGETYRISVKYNTNGTTGLFGNGLKEKMLLAVNTSQDPANIPTVLTDVGTFNATTCKTATGDYLAPSDGTYYFGIKCYSAANQGILRIDDITISIVPPSETTDATVTDVVVPNYNCGLGTSEDAVVTIKDEGANNITTCAIEYNLNGAGWLSAGSYSGNISYGQTDTYTFNLNLSAAANQTLDVRTRLTGDGVPANDTYTGYTIPDFQSFDITSADFAMGFEGGDDFSNWRITDNNNDADGDYGTWAFKTGGYSCSGFGYAQYTYSQDNDADDWIFTPCLYLEANETYNITFDYNAQYPFLGTYLEKMKIAMGSTATPAGMTTTLNDYGTFAKIPLFGFCYDGDIDFTVPSDGIYYIGWQAYSDADQYNVILDNINIITTTPQTYYSVAVGDVSDAVWSPTRNGTPQTITTKSTNTLIIQENFDVNVDYSFKANNLTIEDGAVLTTDNNKTITIYGDWTNDGYFDYIKSTVVMTGSGTQTISGNNIFNNLTVNCANGITLQNGIDTIVGALTVQQGILNTSDALVLRSDADGTARVATINSGNIIGDAVVQRYIPAGETNYRMLASAVQDATIQDWKDDFLTSGFQGSHWPNWPSAANPFYSIQHYNETATGAQNQGYEHPNSAADPLVPGRGYWIWCGDKLSGTNAFTTDVIGPLNTGDIDANLVYTNTGTPTADGWNLVGNPYASPLDWSDIITTELSKKFYVYDPQSGNMDLWNELDGSNLYYLNGNIESGQAFWVQANSTTSLIIEEVDKATSSVGLFETEIAQEIPMLSIDINSEMNHFFDRVKLKWNDNATLGVDDYDAAKFNYGNYYAPRMAFEIEDRIQSISSMPAPTEELDLSLKIWASKAGDYTLTFSPDADFLNNTCLIVYDNELDVSYTLTAGMQLPISLINGQPSYRYAIKVAGTVEKSKTDITCNGVANGSLTVQAPTTDLWDVLWEDFDGNELLGETISGTPSMLSNLKKGSYTAILSHESCGTKNITFEVEEPAALELSTQVTNETCFGAKNGLISFNNFGGNAPYETTVDGNPILGSIINNLKPGNYNLQTTDANGCTVAIEKLIVKSGKEILFAVEQDITSVIIEENTPVQFSYYGETPDKIVWDFGDGGYATSEQTNHIYSEIGVFQVNVLVTKNGCTASHSPLYVEANSSPTSISENTVNRLEGAVHYNNNTLVFFLNENQANINYEVVDLTGKLVNNGSINKMANGKVSILLPELSTGSYLFKVNNENLNQTHKFIVTE
jgi:hypothetical protein